MSHSVNNASPTRSAEDPRLPGIVSRNYRKLMPILVLAYIIAFIDRTNIGMVKEELDVHVGISAAAFGLGAGLFFVAYAFLEIPSNLIMHKVGARFWIARIMLTWGILSMAMAFVWNEASFYVLRILLGAAEAGLYPGIILYITYWFPKKERAKAIGVFLLGVSLANIIGAPLAGLLLQMHGFLGLHGYQWMFIIEGAPAVLLCFWVWFRLPNGPREAKWMSEDEKNLLIDVLKQEDTGEKTEHGGLRALGPVLKDLQIWLVVLIYFAHQIAVYSLSYFLPSMIRSYNDSMDPLTVGLITALPWIAAAIGSVLLPRFATNTSRARMLVSGGMILIAGGLFIAARSGFVVAVVGFCISAFMLFVIQSVLFTFPSNRMSGAAAASGIAFINTCGLIGGFIGPTVMGSLEESTGNQLAGLWFIMVFALIAAALAWLLKYKSSDEHTPALAQPTTTLH
ncbi:Major facilitator family transporter [Corynebacterium deserti GIMN1.010]|uniref:Major facilitator family transporter n=1 Tax=Corynebacterium deserti GIMN1.010 TaxID=931089 RepID=A0A0M4CFV3_9CORY|nr:MFS transporter [Corynebacterium deserti]ALC07116.1 Major facilitator family transporter [Corynebacterium deserti GIMN1.010]